MRKLIVVVVLSLVFATLSWGADQKLKNIPRQKYGNGRSVVEVFSQAASYEASSSPKDAERLKTMGSLPAIAKTIVQAMELVPISDEDQTTVLINLTLVDPETDFPGIDQKTQEWMRTSQAFSFGSWPLYLNWPELERKVLSSPNTMDVRAGFISLIIVHELSDLIGSSEDESFDAMHRQVEHLASNGVFNPAISTYAHKMIDQQRETTKVLRRDQPFAALMPVNVANAQGGVPERKCTDERVDVSGLALPEIETAPQVPPGFSEAAVAVEQALALVPNWVQELDPCAFDYVIFVDGEKSFSPVGKKSAVVLNDETYFFTFTDRKTGKVLPHVYINVRPFTRILLPLLRANRKDTLARISVHLAHELAERRGRNPYAAEIVQIGHLLNIGYINPNVAETMRAQAIAAKDYWDKGPLPVAVTVVPR